MCSYISDVSRFYMSLNHVPIFAILFQSFKKQLMFIFSPPSHFYSWSLFLFLLYCLCNSKSTIQIFVAFYKAFIIIICFNLLFSIDLCDLKHILDAEVLLLLLILILNAIDICLKIILIVEFLKLLI